LTWVWGAVVNVEARDSVTGVAGLAFTGESAQGVGAGGVCVTASIIDGALVYFGAGCSVTLVSCFAGAIEAAWGVGAGCGGMAAVAAVFAFVDIPTAIDVGGVSAAAVAGGFAGVIIVVIASLFGIFNAVAAPRLVAVCAAGVWQGVGVADAVIA